MATATTKIEWATAAELAAEFKVCEQTILTLLRARGVNWNAGGDGQIRWPKAKAVAALKGKQ